MSGRPRAAVREETTSPGASPGGRLPPPALVPATAALLLGAAFLLPGPASAQERDTTVRRGAPDSVRYLLRGLKVEAARPTLTGGGASAVELRLDSVSSVPSPTLAEVLRQAPLVRVRRNSRGQVQPSLRGMEERQIAVLVDEVPITIGWDNRTDLSVVPLTAANRIEMVRGLSSVLAGPNALGGVIKVGITQGPFPDTVRHPFRVRTSLDHTGAAALSGEGSHLWGSDGGGLWLRYGAGYRDRSGYALPALPQGQRQAARGAGGRLLNSDMQYANGFGALRYQAEGGGWFALSTSAFRTEQGVVPELHLLESRAPGPRFWRYPDQWRSVTSLSAGTGWRETPLGRGDLEASVGLDFKHTEIDAYAGPAYRDSVGGETGDDRTLTFRLLGDHTLGAGTLSGAVTVAETWHEQVLSDRESPEEFKQRLWSVGVETDQRLDPGGGSGGAVSDPRVTVGFSLDGASTPLTGDAPPRPAITGWGGRASLEATVADGETKVHGGVSRKVRFPALRELFSGALGKFEPNPDLGPLTLKVGEVGTTLHLGSRMELQGVLFQQRLEGAVVRAVLPSGKFQRQNRGETRATGAELLANLRAGGFVLRGDLTLQDVRLLDDDGEPVEGERAEYQPELALNLRAEAPEVAGVRARAGVEYLGAQFGADPRTGEFVRLDPSAWVEAGLSRRFHGAFGLPRTRVSAAVENLTDELVWDQLGLPRPGRTLRVELEVY